MEKPKPSRVRRVFLLFVLPTLLMLVVASPWLLRAYRLWVVSDVPLPFNEATFGTVAIDSDHNAFELYHEASRFLKKEDSREYMEQLETAYKTDSWTKVPPLVRDWVERNQPGFDLFLEGTKRPDALHVQPRDYVLDTDIDDSQNLREFARLGHFVAFRQQTEGNLAGAWEIHRAVLRASRHLCLHSCINERLTGIALHGMASDEIVKWAQDPQVDATQLRSALGEVRSIYRMTPPASVNLCVEYFAIKRGIDNPLDYAEDSPPPELRRPRKKGFSLIYFIGEPEYSHRIVRHVLTNWMSQMDLPHRERTAQFGSLRLYELPASATVAPGGLTPHQLQEAADLSLLARFFLLAGGGLANSVDREKTRQSLLELHLAVQLYAREHGNQLPETLDALVPKYVDKLPLDFWGSAVPLRYRREPGTLKATLWSVGPDEVDDSGKMEWRDGPMWNNGKGKGDWVLPFPKEE